MVESEWNPERVRDYTEASQASIREFVEYFDHPFLVLVGLGGEAEHEDEDYFTTRISKFDIQSLSAIAEGRALDPESVVFKVVKRPSINPYAGMITIGRASNCDIVIAFPGVSKFHAYIKAETSGSSKYVLGDGGSRNGTKLNDRLLEPKQRANLKTGDSIMLGASVTLRFFTVEGFWRILQRQP